MKNVQISEELFKKLIQYHLLDNESLEAEIIEELERKLEAIVTRNLYSKYKTASTKEEQETARIEYLDRKGYNKDFRW